MGKVSTNIAFQSVIILLLWLMLVLQCRVVPTE